MSETAAVPGIVESGEYIKHHLENLAWSPNGDVFWTFHLDTIGFSVGLGVLFTGLFWLIGRKASVGVPGAWQNAVEWVVEFIEGQVHNTFHRKNRLVAPLAMTIFVWVLLVNMMDFLPVDFLPWVAALISGHPYMEGSPALRVVASSDLNMTAALALTVFILLFAFTFLYKGPVGLLKEMFFKPFGKFAFFVNPIFWLIETIARPVSLSLRLFGNMYAGELVFVILSMTIPSFASWNWGLLTVWVYPLLNMAWSILHIVIVLLQAFLFMTITVVYLTLASEEH